MLALLLALWSPADRALHAEAAGCGRRFPPLRMNMGLSEEIARKDEESNCWSLRLQSRLVVACCQPADASTDGRASLPLLTWRHAESGRAEVVVAVGGGPPLGDGVRVWESLPSLVPSVPPCH